jgi:DNA-binding response OmpR family regulator
MSTRPILIVEDDDEFRAVLADQLAAAGGFAITVATTLNEATQLIDTDDARFDMIILDVSLPDGDGCDFCVQLRRNGCHVPVIMLTGASSETDVVRGLDAGASDYVVKPFRSNELIARIRAQLDIFDNSIDAVFSIGEFTFRPSARLLLKQEQKQRIRLTGKEVELLKFLYKIRDCTATRQTLLDNVWGYSPGATTHTLETHIYRLRQKIEIDPKDCQLLVSVPGGYHLAKGTHVTFASKGTQVAADIRR